MSRTLRTRLLLSQVTPVLALGSFLVAAELLTQTDDLPVVAPLLATLVATALALLLGWRESATLASQLGRLTTAVRKLGAGRLDERLAEPAMDTPAEEISTLMAAFNQMGADVERVVDHARAERARLFAVLERSADGVLAVDERGILRFVNVTAQRLLEIPQREAVAAESEVRSFVSVVRDHELDSLLRTCRAQGEQQTRVVQLGTRRRPVEAIFLPLTGAGSWRYLGLLHDLTEVRRVEGQRRDFVSNVSHELRTPLASIKAVVEVLADGGLDDHEQALEFLAGVDHEVDRLSQLVEEMLELSRIESGHLPFEFEAVEAEQLCAEAVRRLAAQAERSAVSLEWSVAPDLPPLRADYERLLRALINLVHNAIKFTAPGGWIRVTAQDRGGCGALTVQDSGAGIAQPDLERIFERFYKVDRARATSGTGLGLAIVKHTVQVHDGRVEVESERGAGSTFRMIIPYESAVTAPATVGG